MKLFDSLKGVLQNFAARPFLHEKGAALSGRPGDIMGNQGKVTPVREKTHSATTTAPE